MLWDERQNRRLYSFYQRLIKLRQESAALRQGTRWAWLVDPVHGRYGYLRRSSSETIAVALNISNALQRFDLPSVTWRDAFSGDFIPGRINLEPYCFVVARQG
jgi:glycosidase